MTNLIFGDRLSVPVMTGNDPPSFNIYKTETGDNHCLPFSNLY